MAIRIKTFSFSMFGAGTTWEMTKGDKDIARRVIRFLEDRRVLFGERGRHPGDAEYCLESVRQMRTYLGEQLIAEGTGKVLTQALQEMQRACRRFIDEAGPGAEHFRANRERFLVAAGELRATFGIYVAALANKYKLTVDDDLKSILPMQADQDDQSAVPGLELDDT
jgi:hypothetical protein